MKNSPCAKFTMPITPMASARPIATRAYSPADRTPEASACSSRERSISYLHAGVPEKREPQRFSGSAAGSQRSGGAVERVDDLPYAVLVLEDQPHLGAEALVRTEHGLAEAPVAHRRAESAGLQRSDERFLVGGAGSVDRVGQRPQVDVSRRGHVVIGLTVVHRDVSVTEGHGLGVGQVWQVPDQAGDALCFRTLGELGRPAWRGTEDVLRLVAKLADLGAHRDDVTVVTDPVQELRFAAARAGDGGTEVTRTT